MTPTFLFRTAACAAALLLGSPHSRVATEPYSLRAGAAIVNITPAPDAALPMSGYAGRTEGFKAIHDDLNVRAIVVADGATQAAIIGCEVIGIAANLVDRIVTRLTKETSIPRDNILLAAVH